MDDRDTRHLAQLLRHALDDFVRRINERRMFEPAPVKVGPAQDLVLQYLDEEGTNVDELARLLNMPRAALDAILDETMLPTNFLERDGDTIRYTPLGLAGFASSRRTIAAIEETYLNRLGPVRYAVLKEALADLAPRR